MGNIAYSAVVLDEKSRSKLLAELANNIPKGFEIIAHHMTINMGEIKPEYEKYLGFEVKLIVKTIGYTDKVLAVGVDGFKTVNKYPHITIAVNRENGGKPFMSNQITNWKPITFGFELNGIVKEVPR